MEYLPAIALTFVVVVALGLIVGAVRALRFAILAYRAAESRGVAPIWAVSGAIAVGVIMVLMMIGELRRLRTTDEAQQPPRQAVPVPRAPPALPALVTQSVTVTTHPSGAAVSLNGESLGESPLTHQLQFNPSTRLTVEIKVSKPGYSPHTQIFSPSVSTPPQVFDLQLERNNRPLLRLTTEPREVEVLLEKVRVASVTPAELELRNGAAQTLVIRSEGFITEERVLNGQEQSLEVKLRPGAVIEVSCARSGSLMLENGPRPLPARVTVEPNSRQELVIAFPLGKLIQRSVVTGAAGTVTRVTVD